MALNPSNSSNLEQLALKGLIHASHAENMGLLLCLVHTADTDKTIRLVFSVSVV